ncbi:hypothetical protein [Sphingobacterium chungjuense]|uniref:hypothetical protein n=1 Tax=Sphingobacterium chungjuense TaxID=2675553 RepID=UPI001408597C|nr:hypothetical protein [Sphingobacterium chungjuense]
MYTSIQKTTNIFKLLALGLLINIAQSCSQKSDPMAGHGEKIEVRVSLTDAIYEEVSDLSRAATPYLTDPYARSRIQRGEEIQLDEDLFLTAELIPERRDDTLNGELFSGDALKDRTRAAAEITPVTTGVAYKLLVYAANGGYVTERDYIRGQEASAPALLLDGGYTYSFIAYSVNTTTAPPAVTFTGGTQTLAASNVSITGVQDFMYFRQEMTVLGSTTNNLNVILRHRMSQITTTINANAVAYNVTAVTASFSRHQPSATVPLSTGLPTRSGTIGTRAVTFASLGTRSVTSTPTIINAAANSLTNFVISSIQIGDIIRTSLTPFTNLTVTPGVKYNLVLNITPNDIFTTLDGRPAARINGKLWLRHDEGVLPTHDADNFGSSNEHLVGRYFQWGIGEGTNTDNTSWIATPQTQPGSISGYNTSPITTSWTLTRSPCRGGTATRLPTVAEVNELYAATVATNIGNWNNSATNFTAAKVFTSRRNANVKLTFPTPGYRLYTNGSLNFRGDTGFYWLLGSPSANHANNMYITQGAPSIENRHMNYGLSIRCVTR